MESKKLEVLLNLEGKSTDLLSQIYSYLIDSGERYITAQLMLEEMKSGLARQGYSWDAFPAAVIKWVERGIKASATQLLKKTITEKDKQGMLFSYPETFTVITKDGFAHVPASQAMEKDILDHFEIQEKNIEDSEKKLEVERRMFAPVLAYMQANNASFGAALKALEIS
jgi:hypothetical protein